ncbi:metallo-beta-lactamase family protein [Campylobacter blaseri]|uniref:MBL fold metallo-hydrolase n=1 Tax=Campylobacter blaseri TaxID=2042961 RepID=A0A2P8R254_9BACT|nr:MBL fold metallo-hydrolase [Campylobacter blaseri]PSM52577.1 MBL fold metallo-hydrolase [Campylobacter blaseri]PSM54225.1 MBL fold metallo-hydrolase [Campylobacter blaseri]QKF85876.1 metallo-beta-lactamase family protein [Campylobacter blaseri]
MQYLVKEFGSVMTNCYILDNGFEQLVIDPGENSYEWVKQNSNNILAVLNTHGHYDHVYDNYKFQKDGVEIYIHKDDAFLVSNDPFGLLKNGSSPDVLANDEDKFKIGQFSVKFHHFPGHTPGCSMIEIGDFMFSGDFLFNSSIGRFDFPFSNSDDMKKSLLKVKNFKKEFILLPGHGEKSTLQTEISHIDYYLKAFGF